MELQSVSRLVFCRICGFWCKGVLFAGAHWVSSLRWTARRAKRAAASVRLEHALAECVAAREATDEGWLIWAVGECITPLHKHPCKSLRRVRLRLDATPTDSDRRRCEPRVRMASFHPIRGFEAMLSLLSI